ncbi:MAG TPA: nicotinamide riboside transporter PnuC [Hungateiclostridium thermocellum]|jgi:nicotinamide mononucleotide transporter|uniref:Nicotinamide mononucleotide transporter PnuC n=2 Tax=Acetivibrio thermocellus TaxID=1515 RepID=A3DJ47_ACET2|nr:nicotinamide riboside transporter PnuC [Acetivibrio thermocellus]ABN53976.1 nicotinamide mononucleotide transporter PnuC [Acetivibrio thermocellus ATCC 27405]ADU73454.1 nicotinamide mononucleotide transporter PnuC [Acetivibrio thermocellus DSM 1313]ALX07376.1 nicotinamide mononucleotide transporter PnuC [Acetivibrio thermocellus AD2]ANV75114.1 nicotinamide mononucleotide transporter PnuC [Acetivibrio thermocellus DSM 2360]EIC04157.1 nicotinamide mononucleotide transporter PnuC [Acetivibrio 
MEKIAAFIKDELSGWKLWEILWITTATMTILSLSIYLNESLIGIIMAISGVICVVLTGKGKLSSYVFGMVNTLLYAYIAYGAKYYGDVMLNLLYYAPMNVVGWVMWNKHMSVETKEVEKKRMKNSEIIVVFLGSALGIFLYGLILKKIGGSLPFVDALTTVLSIVAQILCVKRYMEQWVLWIIIDVVSVYMWAMAFVNGGESVATLIMWGIYMLNAIFMFVKWYRESRRSEINV